MVASLHFAQRVPVAAFARARALVFAATFAFAALLAGAAPAGATVLRASVVGNGAIPSTSVQTGAHHVLGTAGQGIIGLSSSGIRSLHHGFWSVGLAQVLAVDPALGPGADLPHELSFSAPCPNPTRGSVSFALALPRGGHAELSVFDLQGRLRERPLDRVFEAGRHTLTWTPSSATAAGVYFAVLRFDQRIVARRRVVRLN